MYNIIMFLERLKKSKVLGYTPCKNKLPKMEEYRFTEIEGVQIKKKRHIVYQIFKSDIICAVRLNV